MEQLLGLCRLLRQQMARPSKEPPCSSEELQSPCTMVRATQVMLGCCLWWGAALELQSSCRQCGALALTVSSTSLH